MANENKMKYEILGLLSHTSMIGYEMKKVVDTTMSLFWSGSYGSIYPTLQRLKSEGSIIDEGAIGENAHKHFQSASDIAATHTLLIRRGSRCLM